MTKTEQTIPILTMEILIDLDDIVNFNDNLGENGKWGYYDSPFEANQFSELKFNFKKTRMPVFGPSSCVNLSVKPSENSKQHWDLRIDYVRLNLVCPGDFNVETPRNKWKKILNLKKTDGAVGMFGDFFLGENKRGDFLLHTNKDVHNNSLNIVYAIQFSISVHNIRRYCLIDPLIKTSSEDEH